LFTAGPCKKTGPWLFEILKSLSDMQKIRLLIILFLAVSFTRGECQQSPTLYPGSVPMTAEDENRNHTREQYASFRYLTREGYEKVRTYYVKENREPRSESIDGESRTAFFSYLRRMPDDAGVYVAKMGGRSRVPNRIFTTLGNLGAAGIIPPERAEEVENKYGYLAGCYFTMGKDERENVLTMDEVIYRKYEGKMGMASSVETMNQQQVMEKVQELMNSGRMQEGMELMKKFTEQQIAETQVAISPQVVDIWIECLEEIAANAYTVMIHVIL
jgi:hypothetical protein